MAKERIIHKNTASERAAYRGKVAAARADMPALHCQGMEARRRIAADRTRIEETCRLLRAERVRQGLTLAELEDRTGISRGQISRLENLLENNPTIATLGRLAKALGQQLTIELHPAG